MLSQNIDKKANICYHIDMNELERKQWLENNKDKIRKYCELDYDWLYKMYESTGEVTEKDKQSLRRCVENTYNSYMNSYTIPEANDKEEVCGIDLKPYLAQIRYIEDHEEEIILFIKDNKVVKEEVIVGLITSVPYEENREIKIINTAKELNADIYRFHNHPVSVSAGLSDGDKKNYYDRLLPLAEKEGVKIIGYGAVTFGDYCNLIK